jgi:DNA-directed RNA polymerase subunit RPC12/RpoP
MPAKGETLLKCPDCGKKGVHFKMSGEEDGWSCRYCEWWTFSTGHDRIDVIERRKLAALNPDQEIWVTDPELAHLYLEDEDADQQ